MGMRKMGTAGTAGINKTPVTSETAEAHDEAHVETAKEVSICTRIRNLRAYLDLSQAAFGEPLGLSPTHIARLEQGISEPSQSIIDRICEKFGVDPRYFAQSQIPGSTGAQISGTSSSTGAQISGSAGVQISGAKPD